MDLSRLGPLEQSIVKALLHAETVGTPLSVPQIWRCLPSYSTHLSNVLEALAAGSPLAAFLTEARGQYVLRDRDLLLSEFGRRRQRAELLWTELQRPIEALCRESSICGLALMGSMAWGLPPAAGQATGLFVISAPMRSREAAEAVQLAAANSPLHRTLAAPEIITVDELSLAPGNRSRALELLSLRPVLGESAFMTLWEQNSWLLEAFPNFDLSARLGGDVPDVLLAEVLEDRRSSLRRSLARRVRRLGGAVRALGRRRGQRRGAGESGAAAPLDPGPSTALLAVEQPQEYLEQRWAVLQDWLLPDPVVETPSPQVATPVEPEQADVVLQGEGPATENEPGLRGGRRGRRVRRPARQLRAAASGESGQRGRGGGRRRSRRGGHRVA